MAVVSASSSSDDDAMRYVDPTIGWSMQRFREAVVQSRRAGNELAYIALCGIEEPNRKPTTRKRGRPRKVSSPQSSSGTTVFMGTDPAVQPSNVEEKEGGEIHLLSNDNNEKDKDNQVPPIREIVVDLDDDTETVSPPPPPPPAPPPRSSAPIVIRIPLNGSASMIAPPSHSPSVSNNKRSFEVAVDDGGSGNSSNDQHDGQPLFKKQKTDDESNNYSPNTQITIKCLKCFKDYRVWRNMPIRQACDACITRQRRCLTCEARLPIDSNKNQCDLCRRSGILAPQKPHSSATTTIDLTITPDPTPARLQEELRERHLRSQQQRILRHQQQTHPTFKWTPSRVLTIIPPPSATQSLPPVSLPSTSTDAMSVPPPSATPTGYNGWTPCSKCRRLLSVDPAIKEPRICVGCAAYDCLLLQQQQQQRNTLLTHADIPIECARCRRSLGDNTTRSLLCKKCIYNDTLHRRHLPPTLPPATLEPNDIGPLVTIARYQAQTNMVWCIGCNINFMAPQTPKPWCCIKCQRKMVFM